MSLSLVNYVECRNAWCRNAECRYAECRYAECHYAEPLNPGCNNSGGHNALSFYLVSLFHNGEPWRNV